MTPMDFKPRFDVIMKLYNDLDIDFELTIGKRERRVIFVNTYSAEHQNEFVAWQYKYAELSIDYFVNHFRILHAQEAPRCEQICCEDKERQGCKEANQENDAANKCNAFCKHKATKSNDTTHKLPCQEEKSLSFLLRGWLLCSMEFLKAP